MPVTSASHEINLIYILERFYGYKNVKKMNTVLNKEKFQLISMKLFVLYIVHH